MDKIKKLLAEVLYNLADKLTHLADKINASEPNLFDLSQVEGGSYNTFKEGMSSNDYRVRHQAANKLVYWYVHGNGQPQVEELRAAAIILLDQFDVNDGDLSRLVSCWVSQASAETQEERTREELNEQKIYDVLQQKKVTQ